MGTRGALGFRASEQDKLTYSHFDSYPSGLGEAVLGWLRAEVAAGHETQIREAAQNIRLVTDKSQKPTTEDIERLRKWSDTGVSTGRIDDWYCLLRNTQGDPAAILEAGVMEDSHTFMDDSLFCEWAYIVNFDTRELEVYKGFQRKPHRAGRYARPKERGWKPTYQGQEYYYPVKLIAAYSFDSLPQSLEALEPQDA